MTVKPPPPNLVFILVDDMGYGDFSAFNDSGLCITPRLDALMNEGVCLTQHYSASPVCAPARAALLTGRYPHRTGATGLHELRGMCNLALRETTLADVLQAAGYATGLVGKWHNGSMGTGYSPNARGFDEFAGFRSGWQDYYDWILDRNGSYERADGRYLTDVFTDEAQQFIRRHRAHPFFLHLSYNAPHFPLQSPEQEVQPFADSGKFNKAVSTLYGMLRRMDRGVERVLDTLHDCGLAENTVVFFTSDNGPDIHGQGEDCKMRFNCGFNGAKGNVLEGGIRLPMLVRWPAGLEQNRQIHEMVHFCDWFPTMLAMAGLDVPDELRLDGYDVLPLLRGESADVPAKRFWQWNRYQPVGYGNAAMRDGAWKLVRPLIPETINADSAEVDFDHAHRREPWKHFDPITGPCPPRDVPQPPDPELYNIAGDPGELEDLAGQFPNRVDIMLRELETWFDDVEAERATITDEWGGHLFRVN